MCLSLPMSVCVEYVYPRVCVFARRELEHPWQYLCPMRMGVSLSVWTMYVHVSVYVKAARRELEHQRQLELERQRRDQLMAETQREHSHVDKLRLEIGQHRQELDIVACCAVSY